MNNIIIYLAIQAVKLYRRILIEGNFCYYNEREAPTVIQTNNSQ